jgi:hypothetical protein
MELPYLSSEAATEKRYRNRRRKLAFGLVLQQRVFTRLVAVFQACVDTIIQTKESLLYIFVINKP